MTPAEILAGLEDCSIQSFHHADHVAAAWEALRQEPFQDAAGRICRALLRYATHQGKASRYDEALTLRYLRAIDQRRGTLSWPEFRAAFPELFRRDLG